VIAGAIAAFVAYVLFLSTYPRAAVAEGDQHRAPLRALGVVVIFVIMVGGVCLAYQFEMAGA